MQYTYVGFRLQVQITVGDESFDCIQQTT